MKINVYHFSEYDYVCTHLNTYLSLAQSSTPILGQSFDNNGFCIQPLSSDIIDATIDELSLHHSDKALLVWDFRFMSFSAKHEIESACKLLEEGIYQGICFLEDDTNVGSLIKASMATLF